MFERLITAGEPVAALLDPAADAAPAVDMIIGHEQARRLGVLARADGRPILPENLAVEVSYYGAASGKWTSRAYAEGEESHACWGDVTGDVAIADPP